MNEELLSLIYETRWVTAMVDNYELWQAVSTFTHQLKRRVHHMVLILQYMEYLYNYRFTIMSLDSMFFQQQYGFNSMVLALRLP